MAKKKMWVSHEKAARELGYAPCPAASALKDSAAWFGSAGDLVAGGFTK
jgi:dihydroflavonol-4-reductase